MSQLIKHISICISLFAICIFAHAQSEYIFHKMEMSHGLSSNKVNGLSMDSRGYIWIATCNGLNRFDGHRFRHYFTDFDPKNIPSNNFRSISEDGNGVLWVGVRYSEFTLYYPNEDRFDCDYTGYLKKLGLKRDLQNSTIYIDDNKNIWIWDAKGIDHYYFPEKSWVHYDIPNATRVYVHKEKVYILLNDLTIKTSSFNAKHIDTDTTLKQEAKDFDPLRARIFVDNQRGIWVYNRMHDQLYYKETSTSKWVNFAKSGNFTKLDIRDIAQSPSGLIMFAMGHKSLCYYDKSTKSIIPFDNEQLNISNATVSGIKISGETIAISLEQDGFAFSLLPHDGFTTPTLNDKELALINKFSSTSMTIDKDGKYWFGSDGDGIYVYNKQKKETRHINLEDHLNVVIHLYCDHKNRIWACTYKDGVYIFDNETSTPLHIKAGERGLTDNNVWCANEDHDGNVWIGCLNEGLQKWDEQKQAFCPSSIPNKSIIDIALAPDNLFILATPDGHLDFDLKTHKYGMCKSEVDVYKEYNIIDKCVNRITFDSRNWLWEGGNSGLFVKYKYDPSYIHISTKEGLCNNVIHGIVEDNEHNMWISTEHGIARIAIPKGTQKPDLSKFTIQNFSVFDGLKSDKFNSGALTVLGNTIFAGTSSGINLIYPALIPQKRQIPRVYITELFLGPDSVCASVDTTRTYRIPADESNFAVCMSTLNNYANSGILYAYRLESSEKWSYTHNSELIFSHLSPGNYTLELSIVNGNTNGPITHLHIYICYPWWRTWWAILIYIIGVMGIGYLIYLFRKQRKAFIDTISEMQRGFKLAMEKRQNERLRSQIETSNITVTDADEELKKKVIAIIEKNIDNSDFTVEHLSQDVGMSRANLHRKLVALTGQGPLGFMRSIRLQRSKQLLEKSQMTIAEISYAVGFNNPKNYSRYFKEEFGILPSQYRDEHKA